VTGAGSGIGRETVRLLAAEGARVVCLDVDAKRVDEIAAELVAAGHEAHGHRSDVSDPSACRAAVAAAIARFGRLDVLCNVAGIGMMRTIEEVDDALWSRMIGVNLAGPFYLSRAAGARARRDARQHRERRLAGRLRGYSISPPTPPRRAGS
jgi:NAD(P)-dependent dehydrogenase (short-subunit alcohol dehydrogenase family)